MSVGRLIGVIVVIVVLFAIISNPQDSANTTRNGVSNLGAAGSQVVVFLTTIVSDLSSGTSSSSSNSSSVSQIGDSTSYPSGGVETGDGSTEPTG